MRLNRPPGVASDAEPAGGHRTGAGVVRVLSVTAAAVAVCAMGALPAMASSAHTTKHSSKTTVSIPKTAYTHTAVKLSATVTGGKTPTGTVTFWLGTKKLCNATLSKGKGTCDYKFANPAAKTITGKYSGNSTHKTSSATATIKVTNKPSGGGGGGGGSGPIGTTTTITSPSNAAYSYVNAGEGFTLQATVAPTAGDSAPTGTVTFVAVQDPDPVPPNMECTAQLTAADNGKAQCNVQTEVGTWGFLLYQATYTPTAGSEWTTSNSANTGDHKLVTWDITSTLLTFNPSPATANKAVTLTADVTDEPLDGLASAYSVKQDLVTFSIGGVAIPGCANVAVTDPSNGPDNLATCSYTPTTSGPVTIVATYSGDDYALGSSDTETLTVNP